MAICQSTGTTVVYNGSLHTLASSYVISHLHVEETLQAHLKEEGKLSFISQFQCKMI